MLISIIKVPNIPIITSEDQLYESMKKELTELIQEGDILVSAHTPWSRVQGPIFKLDEIIPSDDAVKLAKELDKPASKIEVILKLSEEIIKVGRNVIITQNKAGVICANAGVDESNAGIGFAVGVPEDPDILAHNIQSFVKTELGIKIAVIISDTVGRALRRGAVNIAIGVAGIPAMKSEIGKKDLFGYEMRVSEIAIADEIASAAELLQGQTDEASPLIIIRGFDIDFDGPTSAKYLNRPKDERLFQ
ncbi:MAG: coenzyme F420-0:L-glutamate ligase [Candidatus Kariarchaeaceae archaeon]